MKKILTFLSLSLILILAGCGASTNTELKDELVGDWVWEQTETDTATDESDVNKIEFTFDEDGKYTAVATTSVTANDSLTDTSTVDIEGSYIVNGEELTMSTEKINGTSEADATATSPDLGPFTLHDIFVSYDETTVVASVDNDVLTMEIDGETIEFNKVTNS